MNILGRRIKPVHLMFTLPLLAIWLAALLWAVQHHLGNERYRLGYLAGGVRGVAERNAAMIDPLAVGRIGCEILGERIGAEAACPGDATTGAEVRRLRVDLREALKDLQHLPYFSEQYKTRVLGRAGEGRVFEFRVEVQRRIGNGGFILVDVVHVPRGEGSGASGAGRARIAPLTPGALAQASAAWESGRPSEWITPAIYQVFWPIKGAQGIINVINGAGGTGAQGTVSPRREGTVSPRREGTVSPRREGTVALLALQVERERHSALYIVGLVLMLSFWFIGVGVVTAITAAFVGVIWLFNFLTIWGVGLALVTLALLIWVRKHGAYGIRRDRKGHKPA